MNRRVSYAFKKCSLFSVNVLFFTPAVLFFFLDFGVCDPCKSFKSILKMIEVYLKGVFSGFHGHLKEFQREFQGSFKGISRMFQRSFKGIPRKFLWCFKEVSRVFQWSITWVSRVFKKSLKSVQGVS